MHVIDIAGTDGRDPIDDFDKIFEELKKYSPELASRPEIIVANKIDSVDMDSPEVIAFSEKMKSLGYPVIYVSAVTGEGLDELVRLARETLKTLPPVTVYEPEYFEEDYRPDPEKVRETRVYKEDGKYFVEGEWLYNFMERINFDDFESLNYFQRVLSKNGVFDKLREAGIEERDTVNIYDFEFDFVY